MLKKDFWYDLPKELIAQEPANPRDAARLMVLDRKNDKILHSVFHELPHYLEKGDLLVVNNSKVLPARLMGTKVPTGAVCELLLLRQVKGDTWECLARPGKRMQPGTKVEFGDGSLTAVVDETMPDGNKYVTFTYDTETLYEKLDEFGKMPLPPYITKQLEDQSQYQTVYAKELGSAAAPTAGLHFTPQLMDTIRAMGVNIAEVTLHVGLGTFRPVNEESIEDHQMHSEWYSVSEETAKLIKKSQTDSDRNITFDPDNRPGVSALLTTAALCTGRTEVEIAEEIGDGGSGTLKKYVTESVNEFLAPIRERRVQLAGDMDYIKDVLHEGNRRANEIAEQTLAEVQDAMGMVY